METETEWVYDTIEADDKRRGLDALTNAEKDGGSLAGFSVAVDGKKLKYVFLVRVAAKPETKPKGPLKRAAVQALEIPRGKNRPL